MKIMKSLKEHIFQVDVGVHTLIGDILADSSPPGLLILQSWGDSDAWKILSEYTGRLFIIAAEYDEVIPRGVVNRIFDSAVNAEKRILFVAPRTSHAVFTDLRSNNPAGFRRVFDQIIEMLKQPVADEPDGSIQ